MKYWDVYKGLNLKMKNYRIIEGCHGRNFILKSRKKGEGGREKKNLEIRVILVGVVLMRMKVQQRNQEVRTKFVIALSVASDNPKVSEFGLW